MFDVVLQTCDPHFLMRLVNNFVTRIVFKGKMIFKHGKFDRETESWARFGAGKEIFFINHGVAELIDAGKRVSGSTSWGRLTPPSPPFFLLLLA